MDTKEIELKIKFNNFYSQIIFDDVQVLGVYHISQIFSVSNEDAQEIIKKIKKLSDILGIENVVTTSDYFYWFNQKFIKEDGYFCFPGIFRNPNSFCKEDKHK